MGAGLNRLIFQLPPASYGNDENLVWLTTRQNDMIPAFHIFRGKDKLTLLFSHGNAEDLGMIVNYFTEVSQFLDVNIFAYEYTGYGVSTGKPSEEAVYADIEAAYKYLREDLKTSWDKIVLYGRSIGSGPSIWLASREAVRGMIIQSGIASVYRVGIPLPFRRTLPKDPFPNIDRIKKVDCPVFVIHGVRDEIVPVSHGLALYSEARNSVTMYCVADAGHNDLEVKGEEEFMENLSRFLRLLENAPPQVQVHLPVLKLAVKSPAAKSKKKRQGAPPRTAAHAAAANTLPAPARTREPTEARALPAAQPPCCPRPSTAPAAHKEAGLQPKRRQHNHHSHRLHQPQQHHQSLHHNRDRHKAPRPDPSPPSGKKTRHQQQSVPHPHPTSSRQHPPRSPRASPRGGPAKPPLSRRKPVADAPHNF